MGLNVLLGIRNRDEKREIKNVLLDNGYIVTTVHNIDQINARAAWVKNKFEIVLLEIYWEEQNDKEEIRELLATNIPIILFAKDKNTKLRGLKIGADEAMVYPVDLEELVLRIRNILVKGSIKNGGYFQLADLKIDIGQHIVWKNGHQVFLKPLEFDLLVYLAKNKNNVLSREKILKEIWNTEIDVRTRTVDVHIAQLRKKIGDSVKIKTISRVGYCLTEK